MSRIIRSSTARSKASFPSGYGAGIVMLWDQGTWTPQVDDVDAALKKGDLKFTLDGYKLKGSWVLVRTGGRYPRRWQTARWLLIKHKDDWAGDVDIAEFAPKSVKSDGDFADILAAGQSGDLDLEPSGEGGRDRRDVREDHRAGPGDEDRRARWTRQTRQKVKGRRRGLRRRDRQRRSLRRRSPPRSGARNKLEAGSW